MRTDYFEKEFELDIKYAGKIVTANVKSSVTCDDSTVNLTVQIDATSARALLKLVYPEFQENFKIPGMRPGPAPLEMVEKMYGSVPGATDKVINTCFSEIFSEVTKVIGIQEWVSTLGKPNGNISASWEKNEPLEYFVSYDRPKVTLGQYKGLDIPGIQDIVTDEEVNRVIAEELKNQLVPRQVSDRGVITGDQVVIDYIGVVVDFTGDDNVRVMKFPNAENYTLKIGSGAFIHGFEEQIIGHYINESFYISVVFPENYRVEKLAGKPVVFKVTLKAVSENVTPNLEEYITVVKTEYNSIEEYRNHIRSVEIEKNNNEVCQEVLKKIIENSDMDIPQSMVESEFLNVAHSFELGLEELCISLTQYLNNVGMTKDQLEEEQRNIALFNVKSELLLDEIIRAENIRVTDEEIETEYEKIAAEQTMETAQLKQILDSEDILLDIAKRKARILIIEKAKQFRHVHADKVESKEEKKARLKRLLWSKKTPGETIEFGNYEQGHGPSPIEWIVLENSEDSLLLISKRVLDHRKYHKNDIKTTWEDCDLRKWLNHEFLNIAFSEAEQRMIADTCCLANRDSLRNVIPENETRDKLFLLSASEGDKYFNTDKDRIAAPTQLAMYHGETEYCSWWLRTPGKDGNEVRVVTGRGRIDECFSYNVTDKKGVRPALWIHL